MSFVSFAWISFLEFSFAVPDIFLLNHTFNIYCYHLFSYLYVSSILRWVLSPFLALFGTSMFPDFSHESQATFMSQYNKECAQHLRLFYSLVLSCILTSSFYIFKNHLRRFVQCISLIFPVFILFLLLYSCCCFLTFLFAVIFFCFSDPCAEYFVTSLLVFSFKTSFLIHEIIVVDTLFFLYFFFSLEWLLEVSISLI